MAPVVQYQHYRADDQSESACILCRSQIQRDSRTDVIQLDPPWPIITPIGDAEALVLYEGTIDAPARFLCAIGATGEYWEFTQYDVRRMTCITEGRCAVTRFSEEAWERFRPMREAAAL